MLSHLKSVRMKQLIKDMFLKEGFNVDVDLQILEEQEKECNEFKMQNCSEVNIREHESGKTDLYIEKQIYITIYKLPIILK